VLAGIPVNIVTGRDAAAKSRVLAQIFAARPSGARWAVLVNEGRDTVKGLGSTGPGVYFSEVAEGCICCTAQLPLRVGLMRLLRETEPDRLFIQAPGRARTDHIVRMLTDRWLSPVLALRAIIHVLSATAPRALLDDELHAAQLAAAQVVAVDGDGDMAMRYLAALTTAPVIRHVPRDAIDPASLDLSGPMPVPRFKSGGA
jgi:G3E family GTPase